jgi:O-antigen/teichoic acid export membrane protein
MKNPWILYISIRVGLFAAILALMLALGFDPFFAAVIAAVVSLAVSLIFFNKQRAAVSEAIYKFSKNKADKDTDSEDGTSESHQ